MPPAIPRTAIPRTAISHIRTTLHLRLRVKPGARSTRVLNISPSHVDVAVTEAARDGAANRGVVGLVCKVLGFRRDDVRIVVGARMRDKVLAVEGVRGEGVVVVRGVAEKLRGECGG